MRTTLTSNRNVGSSNATYGGSESIRSQQNNNTMHGQHQSPYQNPFNSSNKNYTQRPGSARSVRSHRSMGSVSSRTALQQGGVKSGTYDGDVLEKRSHVFTEAAKPFTPRILKSTRSSKLSQNKYYMPPPQKRETSSRTANDTHEQQSTSSKDSKPKPKPRQRPQSPQMIPDGTMEEDGTLMYETLRTRDFSKFEDQEQMVPRLDISMDKDHMDWIKEQASKAQIRQKSSTMKKSMVRIQEDDSMGSTSGLGETSNNFNKTNR